MKEKIFNGIKYRLDEDNMTAEVIQLKDDIQLDDDKLAIEQLIKAIFNGYEGDIIIPEAVVFDEHTYRVTSIGEKAFADSYSLKSVTIPDSVTEIDSFAFENCSNLKTINYRGTKAQWQAIATPIPWLGLHKRLGNKAGNVTGSSSSSE